MTEAALERAGFAIIDGRTVDRDLSDAFGALVGDSASGSVRVPAGHALIRLLLKSGPVKAIVAAAIGKGARAVRAIAFDKSDTRNWSVPWHQDRTIAVAERRDSADVRNWTIKSGVVHCEPPLPLLQRMLTLRWHLDEVGPGDGCLRVVPGSHLLGRITAADIAELVPAARPVEIALSAGSVLAMRPLLLHSSRQRETKGQRRVLHVELAAGKAPTPLRWAWA